MGLKQEISKKRNLATMEGKTADTKRIAKSRRQLYTLKYDDAINLELPEATNKFSNDTLSKETPLIITEIAAQTEDLEDTLIEEDDKISVPVNQLSDKDIAKRIHKGLFESCLNESGDESIFINNSGRDNFDVNAEYRRFKEEINLAADGVVWEIVMLSYNLIVNLSSRSDNYADRRTDILETCQNMRGDIDVMNSLEERDELALQIVTLDDEQEKVYRRIERAGFDIFDYAEKILNHRLKNMPDRKAIRVKKNNLLLQVNNISADWRSSMKTARKEMEEIAELFYELFGDTAEDIVDGANEESLSVDEASDEENAVFIAEQDYSLPLKSSRIRDKAVEAATTRRIPEDTERFENRVRKATTDKNSSNKSLKKKQNLPSETSEKRPTASIPVESRIHGKSSIPANRSSPEQDTVREVRNYVEYLDHEIARGNSTTRSKEHISSFQKQDENAKIRGSYRHAKIQVAASVQYDGRIVLLENKTAVLNDINNLNMPLTVSEYTISKDNVDKVLLQASELLQRPTSKTAPIHDEVVLHSDELRVSKRNQRKLTWIMQPIGVETILTFIGDFWETAVEAMDWIQAKQRGDHIIYLKEAVDKILDTICKEIQSGSFELSLSLYNTMNDRDLTNALNSLQKIWSLVISLLFSDTFYIFLKTKYSDQDVSSKYIESVLFMAQKIESTMDMVLASSVLHQKHTNDKGFTFVSILTSDAPAHSEACNYYKDIAVAYFTAKVKWIAKCVARKSSEKQSVEDWSPIFKMTDSLTQFSTSFLCNLLCSTHRLDELNSSAIQLFVKDEKSTEQLGILQLMISCFESVEALNSIYSNKSLLAKHPLPLQPKESKFFCSLKYWIRWNLLIANAHPLRCNGFANGFHHTINTIITSSPLRLAPQSHQETLWQSITLATTVLQLISKKTTSNYPRVAHHWPIVKIICKSAARHLVEDNSCKSDERERLLLKTLQRLSALCLHWENTSEAHDIFLSTIHEVFPYLLSLKVIDVDSKKLLKIEELYDEPTVLRALPPWNNKTLLLMTSWQLSMQTKTTSFASFNSTGMKPWHFYRMQMHQYLLLIVSMVYKSFSLQNPFRQHLRSFFDELEPLNAATEEQNIEMDFIDAIRSQYKLLLLNCIADYTAAPRSSEADSADSSAQNRVLLVKRLKQYIASHRAVVNKLVDDSHLSFSTGNLFCLILKEQAGIFGQETILTEWNYKTTAIDMIISNPLQKSTALKSSFTVEGAGMSEEDLQRSCLMFLLTLVVFNPLNIPTSSLPNKSSSRINGISGISGSTAAAAESEDNLSTMMAGWQNSLQNDQRDLDSFAPLIQLVELIQNIYTNALLDSSHTSMVVEQLIFAATAACSTALAHFQHCKVDAVGLTVSSAESPYLQLLPSALLQASIGLTATIVQARNNKLKLAKARMETGNRRADIESAATVLNMFSAVIDIVHQILQNCLLPLHAFASVSFRGHQSAVNVAASSYFNQTLPDLVKILLGCQQLLSNYIRQAFITLSRRCNEMHESFTLSYEAFEAHRVTTLNIRRSSSKSHVGLASTLEKLLGDNALYHCATSIGVIGMTIRSYARFIASAYISKDLSTAISPFNDSEAAAAAAAAAVAGSIQFLHPEIMFSNIYSSFELTATCSTSDDSFIVPFVKVSFWEELIHPAMRDVNEERCPSWLQTLVVKNMNDIMQSVLAVSQLGDEIVTRIFNNGTASIRNILSGISRICNSNGSTLPSIALVMQSICTEFNASFYEIESQLSKSMTSLFLRHFLCSSRVSSVNSDKLDRDSLLKWVEKVILLIFR